MKIRSQLFVSMIIFGVVLIVVSASMAFTEQQIAHINNDAQKVENIQTGAGNLAYIANEYFQNRRSFQFTSWQNQYSNVSNDLSQLTPATPEETALVKIIEDDLQRLGAIFNDAASYIQNLPQNETGAVHPVLKTHSARLAVQNQALAFDASVLSKNLKNQTNQLRQTNNALVFAILGTFTAYFVTVYFIAYRRALRSITKLREETKIIGSGNLDHAIVADGDDEISGLSRDFN